MNERVQFFIHQKTMCVSKVTSWEEKNIKMHLHINFLTIFLIIGKPGFM